MKPRCITTAADTEIIHIEQTHLTRAWEDIGELSAKLEAQVLIKQELHVVAVTK